MGELPYSDRLAGIVARGRRLLLIDHLVNLLDTRKYAADCQNGNASELAESEQVLVARDNRFGLCSARAFQVAIVVRIFFDDIETLNGTDNAGIPFDGVAYTGERILGPSEFYLAEFPKSR